MPPLDMTRNAKAKLSEPGSDPPRELQPARMLITPAEAAFALSVSERKLWSMTNAGEIPCVRMGRAVRYSPTDLQDWIDQQRAR